MWEDLRRCFNEAWFEYQKYSEESEQPSMDWPHSDMFTDEKEQDLDFYGFLPQKSVDVYNLFEIDRDFEHIFPKTLQQLLHESNIQPIYFHLNMFY